MIGLLIQDNQYEQDARELLMSFYPGETYAHEVKDELDSYIEIRLGDNAVFVLIWENGATPEGWKLSDSRTRPSDLSDHSITKNVIKKASYLMLVVRTDKEMPWGSFTGIRPTKIALTRLEEGWKEEDIRFSTKETCLASDEKIDPSIRIAAREKEPLGPLDYGCGYNLYVGISFCPTTCLYCSFTFYPIEKRRGYTGLYLEALLKELEYTARKTEEKPLDTIYFDGGIPTSPPAEDLEVLLSRLEQLFDLSRVLEFTMETGRPDSITPDRLRVLRNHGVTRISISPQTTNQKTLDLIGHHHTVEMVKECFYMAQGLEFDNISMDLTTGLPEGSIDDVQRILGEVRVLRPDSLTVHSLAIKRAARLDTLRGKYDGLRIQDTPEMIELNAACAREIGMELCYLYHQRNMVGDFENVGYSLPGKIYIYSILIMEEMQTIAACGAGTTTKVVLPPENHRERCENTKEVKRYISRVDEMI